MAWRHIAVLLALLASCGSDDNPCPGEGELLGVKGVEQWCAISDGHGGWTKHGPFWEWYEDGALGIEGRYCMGTPCGAWIWWNHGQKIREGAYNDAGEQCGTWRQWSAEGDLVSEEDHGTC